jgi:Cu2+-exporting ATPase
MSAAPAAATDETGLFLEGLRCAGCARRVEQLLSETPGVAEAAVDFASLRAWVRHDPDVAPARMLVRRVESLGYAAAPYDPQSLERPAEREGRQALARLLVAAFLAGNVMVAAGALYLGEIEGMDAVTRRALRWLCVALSLPAATFCAWPFWRGALSGLRRGEVTMDLPIVVGICAALAGNVLGTWGERPRVVADSAAMIVFLVLLGRTLERRGRAGAAGGVEGVLGGGP